MEDGLSDVRRLNAAIAAQLRKIAHSSFLGATHPLAIELAGELVALWPAGTLSRVFYSDDGSTAIESAPAAKISAGVFGRK